MKFAGLKCETPSHSSYRNKIVARPPIPQIGVEHSSPALGLTKAQRRKGPLKPSRFVFHVGRFIAADSKRVRHTNTRYQWNRVAGLSPSLADLQKSFTN